ncbi:MAG: ATP-binding cassette domain-containing protein [Acholeplasmatales bacterium]|nr:ATP-binding cassette domain-containing protein [Acholeplasmatales bacterium]
MEYVIETKNLMKKYPNKIAVNNVNMHVKKGDIYGFIGKNGAGKTSTMKLILGLSNPTSGEIIINNSRYLIKERKKIGSLIEAPGLFKNKTAFENLKQFSLVSGGTDKEIKEILEIVGLSKTGNRKAGNFSLGMRQRLGIGIALLGNPEILILDEPINGLDPEGIKDVRDTLIKLNKKRGVTLIISSHLLDELAKITTTYGIINDGVLVEEITSSELLKRISKSLKIKTSDNNKAFELLKSNNFDVIKEQDYLSLKNNMDKSNLIAKLIVNSNLELFELSIDNQNFEKYFIERIGR